MSQLRLLTLLSTLVPTVALATNVMGTLHANSTWTPAGNPWVLTGDLTIPAGVTLTIQPGVQLTFASTDGMRAGVDTARTELIVNGTLDARASSDAPISLTATNAYGIRVQGSATLDYVTLTGGLLAVTSSSGTTSIDHSTVQGATSACVRVSGGHMTFSNGTLSDCRSAIHATGGLTSLSGTVVTASGSGYSSTGTPALTLNANANLVHNTIAGNYAPAIRVGNFSGNINIFDNIIASNGQDGVRFDSAWAPYRAVYSNNVWGHGANYTNVTPDVGTISANPLFVSSTDFRLTDLSPARFAASDGTDMGAFGYAGDVSSTLQGTLFSDRTLYGANTLAGDLTIRPGVTLTLAPGASLTFASTDGMRAGVDTARTELIVDGTLDARASSDAPISLTATNAYGIRVQGSATLDYVTLTGGLLAVTSSSGTTSIDHSTVQGATSACVRVSGGHMTFSNGTLSDCRSAIHATGGLTSLSGTVVTASGSGYSGTPALTLNGNANLVHNTIAGNYAPAIRVGNFSGNINIFDNIIASNGQDGVRFDSAWAPYRAVYSNNVWGHGANYTNVTPDVGTISVNPLFVSSTDFRLQEYSPCRYAASDGTDMGAFPYAP